MIKQVDAKDKKPSKKIASDYWKKAENGTIS
jgi:hypothetical protein